MISNKVDPYYQRQEYKSDSSFWQYKFADIRRLFSDSCSQTGVGWLKLTNLQFSHCYIFVSFRNIIVPYDDTPFWISADAKRMTLNNPECPVQLKLRLADSTLDMYVCYGFWSLPCVTELTWALTVGDKMWPMNCCFWAYKAFWAYEACTNFREVCCRGGTEPEWGH